MSEVNSTVKLSMVLLITFRNEVAKVIFSQVCVSQRAGGGILVPGGAWSA